MIPPSQSHYKGARKYRSDLRVLVSTHAKCCAVPTENGLRCSQTREHGPFAQEGKTAAESVAGRSGGLVGSGIAMRRRKTCSFSVCSAVDSGSARQND